MVIYLATNKIDGKRYVGQTIRSLEDRWKDHCRVKDNNYFHRAIRKYGPENFSLEILDTAESEDELDRKEMFWIEKLDTKFPNGYNLRDGGNVSGRGRLGVYNTKSRLIYQFSLDGGLVNGYYGIGDAERRTGIRSSAIHRSLQHGNMLAGGCLWMYAEDFTPAVIAERIDSYAAKKWRAVVCVDSGETFRNMVEAAKKYNTFPNSICACCNGKLKTTAGKHWEYYKGVITDGNASIGDSQRRSSPGTV